MRIGGETLAALDLAPKAVEHVLVHAAFQVGPRIDARRGVTLEVDLITDPVLVLAPKEVVEAHVVQLGRGGEGGDVPSQPGVIAVGARHHHRGVPADDVADAFFHLLVAGEGRLVDATNRVHVVRAQEAIGHEATMPCA